MRAAALLERKVVARADRILFVADGNRTDFAAHYGPAVAAKFQLIPNGCDPREFEALTQPPVIPRDSFVLLHAGSLYAGRSPVPLLKAIAVAIAAGTVDRSRFRLRFLGQIGHASFDLSQAARDLHLEEIIEVVPRVPREESLQAMRSASCLLLLQPGHTVSVPGKLYEYLASGRPILAIAEEGETADIVRRSGVGVSVTPGDEPGMVNALETVTQMAQQKIQAPPRDLYDGMVWADETVRILDAVVRNDGRLPRNTRVEAAAPPAHTR
jgi:glycosyltransferase involved in cell wall biosynthesis